MLQKTRLKDQSLKNLLKMYSKSAELAPSGAVLAKILENGEVIALQSFSCTKHSIEKRFEKAYEWADNLIKEFESE